ncbi:MAG: HD-GYP domain-containing protein [Lachnospiraceae bacterium]|nr:HD-GYP domain-containing protein [Lachnospiraceae bacterium]
MKRVLITELAPGMIVAKDVYNAHNLLVVQEGTDLDERAISKLMVHDIGSIMIVDEKGPIRLKAKEPSYYEKLRSSEEFQAFKKRYDEETVAFTEELGQIVDKGKKIDEEKLLNFTYNIMGDKKSGIGLIDTLQNLKEYDDETYVHSINVAMLCALFSSWLKLSEKETRIAILCGLLHDIGKTMVPEEILRKPEKLSELEFVRLKSHPMDGARLLKMKNVNLHIVNTAMQHHERCDGSGYPQGLKRKQIDPYAKMVAIADVYEAMTSTRVYRSPFCPFTVIEQFEEEGLQKYEVEFLLPFLEHIGNTYLQNKVRLSNGMEGKIVFLNKEKLSRPMIQCDNTFVDLMEHK